MYHPHSTADPMLRGSCPAQTEFPMVFLSVRACVHECVYVLLWALVSFFFLREIMNMKLDE